MMDRAGGKGWDGQEGIQYEGLARCCIPLHYFPCIEGVGGRHTHINGIPQKKPQATDCSVQVGIYIHFEPKPKSTAKSTNHCEALPLCCAVKTVYILHQGSLRSWLPTSDYHENLASVCI